MLLAVNWIKNTWLSSGVENAFTMPLALLVNLSAFTTAVELAPLSTIWLAVLSVTKLLVLMTAFAPM